MSCPDVVPQGRKKFKLLVALTQARVNDYVTIHDSDTVLIPVLTRVTTRFGHLYP